jgi:glycosyltransferase involved in cell wall biosynthesis
MTISLITVTYNSGNTLFSTLQSVLSQTHLDIEYIIVDGVSKDHTIDVLKEYEPKFNGRLRWISEPDKGLYDAMNKGIRMATGDVVGILNSDDFFTGKDVLAQVVRAFETDDRLAAVYGDVHFVHPDKLDKCVRYYSSKVFKRKLMRFGFMPAHPFFYLRRKYFGKFGCYKTDYRIAADFEFLLRVIYKGNISIKYLPIDMVTMRMGGVSTSGVVSHKWIMKEHLRAFRENGIYTNVFLLGIRYIYKVGELLLHKSVSR